MEGNLENVQNKMFLRSQGEVMKMSSHLEDSLKFRNWMKRKTSSKTTTKSTSKFGFFEFDQDYSENQISSSSSSTENEEEKMEVEEEEEMSEDVRLFVELTSGSVGDVRLRVRARRLNLLTRTTNSHNLTITHRLRDIWRLVRMM